MSGFADHFSRDAAQYAAFRPTYPKELIEYVARVTKESLANAAHDPRARSGASLREPGLVWDVGTGSGQAATMLAEFFERVVATDASREQIDHAVAHPRVEYKVAREFESGLPDRSVALVTVAQALHWFDVPRFHEEAKRVLAPGGVIAEWCYGRVRFEDPQLDQIVEWFHKERVGMYWPPERRHVDNGYFELEFPFAPLVPVVGAASDEASPHGVGRSPPSSAPPRPRPFTMTASLTIDDFLGYVATWSSTIRARNEERSDPLAELRARLATVWKNADEPRSVTWPIVLRLGSGGGNRVGRGR